MGEGCEPARFRAPGPCRRVVVLTSHALASDQPLLKSPPLFWKEEETWLGLGVMTYTTFSHCYSEGETIPGVSAINMFAHVSPSCMGSGRYSLSLMI